MHISPASLRPQHLNGASHPSQESSKAQIAFLATYILFVHRKLQLVLYRIFVLTEFGLFIVFILKVIKSIAYLYASFYKNCIISYTERDMCQIYKSGQGSLNAKCLVTSHCTDSPMCLVYHHERPQAWKLEDQVICSLNRLLCGENGKLARVMV